MEYKEALTCVMDLRTRIETGFSAYDKSMIERLYTEVLRKDFKHTSCNDCYRDAVIELYSYLKTKNKMKENCDYGLKNGALLQFFGTNEMYTNNNLTNEAAERYLREFPQAITLFANYPKDWEERVNKDPESIQELDEALVAELYLKLSGGATKKSLKEEYKSFQLNGKALTARLLDAYLKAASEYTPENKAQEGKTE